MTCTVHIRWHSGETLPITIHQDCNVAELRRETASRVGLQCQDVRIIFQGHELHDEDPVQDLDISSHSVLHAVQRKPPDTDRSSDSLPPSSARDIPRHLGSLNLWAVGTATGSAGLDLIRRMFSRPRRFSPGMDETPSLQDLNRMQYYIYCKGHCNRICAGKLRVRCSQCKQGTLTVDRDPRCWMDVKVCGRISGHCQSEDCDGSEAEFYFKCRDHDGVDDRSAVALELICPNRAQVPCLTCMETVTPVLVFPCRDQHVMCLDCFSTYCFTRLNDRAFVYTQEQGYTLGCPAGCEDSLVGDPHHFRVLGEEQYERYQRFSTEECLRRAAGVQCPAPGCGEGVFPLDSRRVQCVRPGCRHVFCRDCLEPYHDEPCSQPPSSPSTSGAPSSYHVSAENADLARWEHATKETIRRTTKPCPSCKVPTEKDEGCMHMVCPQCSFQWCWLCVTQWNRECQGNHWFG